MGLWDQILGPHGSSQSSWVWDGHQYVHQRYRETYSNARRVAASLKRRGVGPGTVAAAVITNSLPAIEGFVGAWWAGATVASLPIIARGQGLTTTSSSSESYVAR